MTTVTPRKPNNGAHAAGDDGKETALRAPTPPFLTKLKHASFMYGLQTVLGPMLWVREWKESRNPPPGRPDIVKTYECRPSLPVR
jgi:hypothetical protein